MKRPYVLKLAAVCSLALLGLVMQANAAGTHHPPRAILRVEAQTVRARQGSYQWTRRSGDTCIMQATQGSGDKRQKGLLITPGTHQAVLRINRAVRPRAVRIAGWRQLDRQTGRPIGDAERFPVELRSAEGRGGREIWKAIFTFDLPADHLYLDVYAKWPPFQGCPTWPPQAATWDLHLRASEPIED